MGLKGVRGAFLAIMLFSLTACAIPPELAAMAEPEGYVDPPLATDPRLAAFAEDVTQKSWASMSLEQRETSCWEAEEMPSLAERGFKQGFRLQESADGQQLVDDEQLAAIWASWLAYMRRIC